MDYIELTINLTPRNPWAEILIAELADLGFESFIETEQGIQAYAPQTIGNVAALLEETSMNNNEALQAEFETKVIPHQNWNAQWEADFEPVVVDERLVILAPFHDQYAFSNDLKIIIQPQMSFGTGHHQTTFLMSQYLLDLPQMPKKVLDMGTGTGVLAILAEKRGADDILAVDIESWSVENTVENAIRNHCKHIKALEGDIDAIVGVKFGIILANINKNVLKAHLPHYANLLENEGLLYLSGFFTSDVEELTACAAEVGLKLEEVREKETWASMKLMKC
ncbi:MAG: 50S ribosomal protein L11 methyltransferase [Fluviicola sp.]|nr:50S ribosomal protein L11 methyltransferase [Fluviicola sp.]